MLFGDRMCACVGARDSFIIIVALPSLSLSHSSHFILLLLLLLCLHHYHSSSSLSLSHAIYVFRAIPASSLSQCGRHSSDDVRVISTAISLLFHGEDNVLRAYCGALDDVLEAKTVNRLLKVLVGRQSSGKYCTSDQYMDFCLRALVTACVPSVTPGRLSAVCTRNYLNQAAFVQSAIIKSCFKFVDL